ncbi:MAG TPA: aspartate 1-decarboxylase, partial [candidate division Zixibacteria bacterium]|nr:aspartate 1-decarboxylase [candidate division Zixibacteria bacterium]
MRKMMRIYCKSKIHKARITDVELDYDGSAEIDT